MFIKANTSRFLPHPRSDILKPGLDEGDLRWQGIPVFPLGDLKNLFYRFFEKSKKITFFIKLQEKGLFNFLILLQTYTFEHINTF